MNFQCSFASYEGNIFKVYWDIYIYIPYGFLCLYLHYALLKKKLLQLMAAYKVHVFPDMIAALQQVPLDAVRSEWADKTEAGWVINSYLDECWKSHPTRQQKMKKNLLLANQTPTLHMNSKNIRNHNHGFNNNYVWNMNYSWGAHPIQWGLCVWGSVNVKAHMCYLIASSSVFSLSRRVRDNI